MLLALRILVFAAAFSSCGYASRTDPAIRVAKGETQVPGTFVSNADTVASYICATREYIRQMYPTAASLPDTLYIGRHPDFPDITLPDTVAGARVVMVDGDDAVRRLGHHHNIVYLNIVAWIEEEKAEFLVVTFHDFKPQHNMHLFYRRGAGILTLDSTALEYAYGRTTNP